MPTSFHLNELKGRKNSEEVLEYIKTHQNDEGFNKALEKFVEYLEKEDKLEIAGRVLAHMTMTKIKPLLQFT